MKRGPLRVFWSYAHEDEAARDTLDEHLELLARRNLIIRWHDRHIVPGSEWDQTIQENLESADIILLLVSKAFMASDYVNEVEIPEAMKEHDAGRARVVPVLLEDAPGWNDASFAKLQLLPHEAKPVSAWDDPVEAFADVARGIGRVAKDIIIEGGGPFEFGAHEFSEAELSALQQQERKRARAGMLHLKTKIDRSIPARRYESNLLVATWELRAFGSDRMIKEEVSEALFYMAQVISAFDVVALQEVHRNLERLEALMEVLGPDWSFLTTEVAPGPWGNNERFAILYYEPRVEFRNFSSHVILPPERDPSGENQAVQQLARPPLLAAFRSGDWEFQVCTTHIIFGGGNDKRALERRSHEVGELARFLERRSRPEEVDLLLLGDFQLEQPGSPLHKILLEAGVQIPDEILHPSNIRGDRYFDLIGFVSKTRQMPLGPSDPRSGIVDIYKSVLRDEDRSIYALDMDEARFRQWKTHLISDHLPLWVELALPCG